MDPINVDNDFLEALEHHPYYLAEFLIHKQQKSGWSKGTYLKAIERKLNWYKLSLRLKRKKLMEANPQADISEIGIPLDELSNGKVKEYYTLRKDRKTSFLNSEVLETFNFFLKRAWTHDEPPPVYSDLQMVSFTVKAVEFILDELSIQAEIREPMPFLRGYPKGFKSKTDDGKRVYLLYNYIVTTPTPIFDYYSFEERLRNLALNSKNPDKLKPMLSPLFDMGKKIVTIWNEHIQPLEDIETAENSVKTHRLISFDPQSRDFTIYSDMESFLWNGHQTFSNYSLVKYAAKVGHLIAEEILEEKDEIPNINKADNWENSTYLLFYHHIGKIEGKELTETKVEQIAAEHNLNKTLLRRKFTELKENDFTFKDHTNNKKQFRKDYELMLPVLMEKHPNAYGNVLKLLNILVNTHKTPKK